MQLRKFLDISYWMHAIIHQASKRFDTIFKESPKNTENICIESTWYKLFGVVNRSNFQASKTFWQKVDLKYILDRFHWKLQEKRSHCLVLHKKSLKGKLSQKRFQNFFLLKNKINHSYVLDSFNDTFQLNIVWYFNLNLMFFIHIK